jgi:DNA replication initiation complex subunit (GINS family)
VQTIGQILRLPEDFYPRLRRYLASLRKEASKSPEKMIENEKARQLTRDIVNSRLKKIVSIASAPAQTEQTLKNLTVEERFLYDELYEFINQWRTQILEYEGGEE